MKKIFGLLLGIISLGIVFGQSSVDPMNLPKLDQYVQDFSRVLNESSLGELRSLGEAYNSATTNQLVAVLIPNRNGNELFTIGLNIFNTNQIGQAGKNNGLLLLISTEEKKIRIVVGYGLEGSMPDALANRIIEEDIRPLVNSGDFAGAIKKYYERSIKAIDTGEGKAYQSSSASLDNLNLGKDGDFFWIIGVVIGFIIATSLKPKSKKGKWKKYIIFGLVGLLVLLVLLLSVTVLFGVFAGLFFGFTGFLPGRGGSSFGGGGFGSGGGGGFSGGGGSSGGGGAGD